MANPLGAVGGLTGNATGIVQGLQSTINDPTASAASKLNAKNQLDKLGVPVPEIGNLVDINVLGQKKPTVVEKSDGGMDMLNGYMSTLKNPKSSEEAKKHAEQVLQENGVDTSSIV